MAFFLLRRPRMTPFSVRAETRRSRSFVAATASGAEAFSIKCFCPGTTLAFCHCAGGNCAAVSSFNTFPLGKGQFLPTHTMVSVLFVQIRRSRFRLSYFLLIR